MWSEYSYLGNILMQLDNYDVLLNVHIGTAAFIICEIISIANSASYGNFALQARVNLYEQTFILSLLCNAETWSNISQKSS